MPSTRVKVNSPDEPSVWQLNDPDDIAWQIEVFARMQRTALEPAASRAVLDGLVARFAAR
jgi:hypothetical protein